MVKGKNKGNSFERKIYKELREYGVCKRTLGSGSSDEPADIIFKKHYDHYAIECKHLKKITWRMLLKFWDKLCVDIGGRKYEPMIIFRENRNEILVMKRNITGKGLILVIMSYNDWLNTEVKNE